MTMLREHAIFIVTILRDSQDRIEDRHGELMGYSDNHRISETFNIVAPTKALAEAWALGRRPRDQPMIDTCVEMRLDGFLQDHIH